MAMSPVKAGEVALMGPSEDRQRAVGTPDYLAPELLLGACPFLDLLSGCARLPGTWQQARSLFWLRRNRPRPRSRLVELGRRAV